jgi:hypothetical protein
MRCALCDVDGPDGAPTCWACGYDQEHRDARPAIARVKHQLLRSNVMWLAGAALLFVTPALLFHLGVVGGLGAGLVGSGGVILATFGLINGDRAKKRLVALQKRAELPSARVVD